MSKKSEIVYVCNTAFNKRNSAEMSAQEFLDSAFAGLELDCRDKFIESAKTEGSYKFTLIIERMELPCTVEDWKANQRISIKED